MNRFISLLTMVVLMLALRSDQVCMSEQAGVTMVTIRDVRFSNPAIEKAGLTIGTLPQGSIIDMVCLAGEDACHLPGDWGTTLPKNSLVEWR
jgi:hypothetical protein